MSCNITSGFTLGCRDNVGGITAVYILSGSIAGYTVPTPGLITNISGSGVFYKYELTKNTGNFDETINASLENGTVFYTQTVNVAFHKMQASLRNQVKALALNPVLKIVVQTNNVENNVGQFFLIGRERGATLSTGTGATGTTYGDANQYSLTFEGLEPEPAFEIATSGSLATALSGISVG
jgi:hypothetical protein